LATANRHKSGQDGKRRENLHIVLCCSDDFRLSLYSVIKPQVFTGRASI
jgi:hypothetical protein